MMCCQYRGIIYHQRDIVLTASVSEIMILKCEGSHCAFLGKLVHCCTFWAEHADMVFFVSSVSLWFQQQKVNTLSMLMRKTSCHYPLMCCIITPPPSVTVYLPLSILWLRLFSSPPFQPTSLLFSTLVTHSGCWCEDFYGVLTWPRSWGPQ